MFGKALAAVGVSTALGLALAAPAAEAALPSVGSGQAPGPPLLYAPQPEAPQLSASGPFSAAPLLVSGTDAYRGGEYLYQDYLFDDRGADTAPLLGTRPANADTQKFSPTAGDVQYPSGPAYLSNAADLVEFRVTTTADAIVYRVTLNTVVDPDAAVVGIGIDTDRSGGGEVDWPNGAGVSSPGLDAFITAWGTGGEITTLPGGPDVALPAGSVSIDTTSKQMTISVPRSSLDPGSATWRFVTGTGLWDDGAGAWKTPANGVSPTAEAPASGNPLVGAPAVLNLGFRFDEPRIKQPGPALQFPYTTAPGVGNWSEDKQAFVLGAIGGATTSAGLAGGDDFHADVDFAKLAASADEPIHSPGSTQVRIFPSSLDDEQGVSSSFPEYRGQLQPYLLRIPAGLDTTQPTPLTFALHSLGGNHNQFGVFSPNQLVQFGDERGNLAVTPLAHGADGWYTDEGESDVFEVWADLDRHFNLDPDRSYVSGYSMGGYGTYKLGTEYPDLWAKAFTTVGPPGEGVWLPGTDPTSGPETLSRDLLENVRWVPFLNWAGSNDELVPLPGPIAQQQRFDALGLRSRLLIFDPADHFALAILDEWASARDFLGDATATRDPGRVDYGFFPAADRPALGLAHDHAYWVSGLVARDLSAGARAIARIRARSLAAGQGDPVTAPIVGAGVDAGPALPYIENGTEWTSLPAAPVQNTLQASFENLSQGQIDGSRAQLDGSRELRLELTSDGASQLDLDLPLPPGSTAVRLDGGAELPAPEVALDANGAEVTTNGAGSRTYLIRPPGGAEPGPGAGGSGGGSGAGGPGGSGGGANSLAPGRCANVKRGDRRNNRLEGTAAGDRLIGRRGDDVLKGRAGNDCLFGNRGSDRLNGGPGRDLLSGSAGRDRLNGGPGKDAIKGALGPDLIKSRDGQYDVVNCGPGRDVVNADRKDKLHACEIVKGPARRSK